MKKFSTCVALMLVFALLLVSCGCKHENAKPATCEEPGICDDCGETLEAATGHNWAAASCDVPKHCTNCGQTEGEALGHDWQDATTEAPKTCSVCGETEGERIITDPRFVTASVLPVLGKWEGLAVVSGSAMGIDDFDAVLELTIEIDFCNDGNLLTGCYVSNEDAFLEALINYTIETTYKEFASMGLDAAAGDQALISSIGMDVPTYVRQELANFDVAGVFADALDPESLSGVYYMEGDTLYTGSDWDSTVEEPYTLESGTLSLSSLNEGLGVDVTFTRVG